MRAQRTLSLLAVLAVVAAPSAAFGDCLCNPATACSLGATCTCSCPSNPGCFASPGTCVVNPADGGTACSLPERCGVLNECQQTVCQSNACSAPQPRACPAPTEQCVACSFSGQNAVCSLTPAPPRWNYITTPGANCDDGDRCTHSDLCSTDAGCAGTAYSCGPPPCRFCNFGDCSTACTGDGGCDVTRFATYADGTECGNECEPASCEGGACVPKAGGCPTRDCHAVSCADGGCSYDVVADETPCPIGVCRSGLCRPVLEDADGGVRRGGSDDSNSPWLVNGCSCSTAEGLLALFALGGLLRTRRR